MTTTPTAMGWQIVEKTTATGWCFNNSTQHQRQTHYERTSGVRRGRRDVPSRRGSNPEQRLKTLVETPQSNVQTLVSAIVANPLAGAASVSYHRSRRKLATLKVCCFMSVLTPLVKQGLAEVDYVGQEVSATGTQRKTLNSA